MAGTELLMWREHLRKSLFVSLGSVSFVLGVAGVFLPLLPTTPFMLLALWSFSKSSQRLHDYLWEHPRFGRAVRDWKEHGIVSRGAKISASMLLLASTVMLVFFSKLPWSLVGLMLVMFAGGTTWLLTRPEKPPAEVVRQSGE